MEPATGRQIARVVSGGADLVDRAVAEARRAYGPWRDLSPRERGRLLRLVAAKIRAHVEELAELEAREVGKPRRDALRFDLSYCHAGYDYYAGLADTQRFRPRERGGDAARVRPLEEHPVPVGPRPDPGVATQGLISPAGR
jgi:acyl-CoA reductase-like NAD-dependent aldehyde dehydrogenase